jgi:hypothetical protein
LRARKAPKKKQGAINNVEEEEEAIKKEESEQKGKETTKKRQGEINVQACPSVLVLFLVTEVVVVCVCCDY